MGPTNETVSIDVDGELVAAILAPYKPNCRYLSNVRFEHAADPQRDATASELGIRVSGDFAIPESCYIDDTGHLNSVELNIAYNQIMYVMLAQCIASDLVAPLRFLDLEGYRRRHLPDVLIHRIDMSFKRVIGRRAFRGEIELGEATNRSAFFYFRTPCRFWDDNDGLAKGEISLCFLHRPEDAARLER